VTSLRLRSVLYFYLGTQISMDFLLIMAFVDRSTISGARHVPTSLHQRPGRVRNLGSLQPCNQNALISLGTSNTLVFHSLILSTCNALLTAEESSQKYIRAIGGAMLAATRHIQSGSVTTEHSCLKAAGRFPWQSRIGSESESPFHRHAKSDMNSFRCGLRMN
jgi:hypothetical protein